MNLLQTLHSGITVGEVAAMINGASSFINVTLPLLVVLILIWSIKDRKMNASSWSSAANTLQGTFWPTILRSDSTSSKFVDQPVSIASTTLTIIIVLVFAVNVLTPLPLTQVMQPKADARSVSFSYAPDLTFFGQGTAQRPTEPLHRSCGTHVYTGCTPSESLFEKLASGSEGTTIAGPKDIQFRNFFYYQNQSTQASSNETIAVGLTRPMQYLLLNTGYMVIEGLVVDPIDGGVGIRNHTVPIGLELGGTWQENLLWIQPETVCTANNFSIHFPFGNNYVNEYYPTNVEDLSGADLDGSPNRYLRDDGAFTNLNWTIPSPRWDILGPDSVWNTSGPIPNLEQRAFIAAWWNNYYAARALGISENSTSYVGKQYANEVNNYTSIISPFAITISSIDGAIFDQAWNYNLYRFVSTNLDRFYPISKFIPGVNASRNFSEPFLQYGRRCFGFDDYDNPEPLKPYIRCGNLYGVPIPAAAGQEDLQIGAMIGQEVYTCASSVKATIKTIEFTFNGTSSLKDISVSSIADKNYTNPEDQPLWGVENIDPSLDFNISDINLLWGLVSNAYENDTDITTIRGKDFYLPVAYSNTDMSVFKDTLAASTVFTTAWNSVYQEVAWIAGTSFGGLPSYSGDTQYSLFLKWRNLSGTPDGAARILNLIWTDLVASAVVGTKTGFENNSAPVQPGVLGQRSVHEYQSVVIYGNLLFAIPAFAMLGLWAILLVVAIILFISRQVTFAMILYYMNQSSLGRAVLQAEQQNPRMITSNSKVWTENYGENIIGIRPYGEQVSLLAVDDGAGVRIYSRPRKRGEDRDISMESM